MTWLKATTTVGGRMKIATAPTALTDNSGGTADQTISAAGATYNQAGTNNTRADIAERINTFRSGQVTAGRMA